MEAINNKTLDKLKYALVREKLISYEDLASAETLAKENNLNLAQILLGQNFIQEEDLLKFIEAKLHIPYVNLDDYSLDNHCLKYINLQDAKKYRIIPLFKIEDVLTVAMADPLNLFALNRFIDATRLKIEPIICSERKILLAIKKHYSETSKEATPDSSQSINWEEALNMERHNSEQGNLIISQILKQADLEKAEEIYFEPTFNGLAIKFYKNKKILEKGNIPILLTQLSISSIKTLSGLNPEITAIPQLGKISIENNTTQISAAVSVFPTTKGERVSVKLHKPPENIATILKEKELIKLKEFFCTTGLILVTGKNIQNNFSLCYSMLSEVAQTGKTVFAIESISRQTLSGVTHCEINEKVGFDIEKIIKHLEFQSPDAVYLEEIWTDDTLIFVKSLIDRNILVIAQCYDQEYIKNKAESLGFSLDKKLFTVVNPDNAV